MSLPGSRDVVTGEAVVLELRLARLASRALSLGIDLAVQAGLLLVVVLVAAGLLDAVDPALRAALILVGVVAVLLGYPVAMETLTRGRTLGKLALGLRVVRDSGAPIGVRHALVRGLIGIVEIYLLTGAGALIASLASARGKRLGDMLAGTLVVRERMPAQSGAVARMHPALAAWAAGLDLTGLGDDLALAARQFLARSPQLVPEVRAGMGGRLAAAVHAVVTPPPPPGVPPEPYLSAVLAERSRRELARLQPPGSAYGPTPSLQLPPQPEPPAPGSFVAPG